MSALWSYRPYDRASSIEMGRLETTAPISQAAHFHSEVQVATVTQGRRVYSSPLGDLGASAGDMVIIPAHLPHASQGSTASIVTHLYIPSDHSSVRGIVVPQIIRCVRAKSSGETLDAIGSMRRDQRCDRQLASTGALSKQVMDQELDINSVAAQLGYSTDGFIRAFKRQFGMTPAAYRLAHRLMNARSKLRDGGAVADVAYATSFADQSHFGRLFRRAYGATPAAYRSAFVVT
ncbi:helix-turn-helix domain-containing protein [Bradyrhizobium sp. CB1650]|uniref:AraC family transcriptional regulator n=1 Tax=Bradyrhizobium sp. CB1650 TaxID=3039153 RepID=UPI0024352756|nr:helix-turn-helix domain-containing protein [Bradyrhizobium sp. CB1650]WGD49660.1 helix-turn-helix domain-containing protein [Bradyrhizobium sp. CB1650]